LDIDAVQGCLLVTDVAKSGSDAQHATSGVTKSVRVLATGIRFFAFSATLNELSVYLP
jgi:hypothetical protein